MHILIVDDEPLVRTSMSRMIRSLNNEYVVEEAADGEEAMELLGKMRADLVITDIRMPAVDGLELATYIQQVHPDTYVILLTGYAEFDYALTALRQGVFDYLLKPASKESIIAIVNKVEEGLRERSSKAQINRIRERNVLEKRIQDLLYDLPLPHFDKDLLPPHEYIFVFSLTADRDVLAEKTVRFFIKNVLQDMLVETGVPIVIVEERQVTAVVLAQNDQKSKLENAAHQSKTVIEGFLKTELKIGIGGLSTELSDIGFLYMKSLRELGFMHLDEGVHTVKPVHRLVRAALDYIDEHYATDITLATIADKLEVNANYLSGLFKSETGFTFTHHLTHHRLKKAKELLRDTNLKIYQIGEQVGYSDQAYFSRLFKSSEGITPYDYREKTDSVSNVE
jgi:two-component system response regulator YesN